MRTDKKTKLIKKVGSDEQVLHPETTIEQVKGLLVGGKIPATYLPAGSGSDYVLPVATGLTLGGVKVMVSDKLNDTPNTPNATTGRTYVVQLNANNQMVVNVPWVDTVTASYTLPTASNTVLGGVKLTTDTKHTLTPQSVTNTANRTYQIQTNNDNQLVVNVPWTNTVYSLPVATSSVRGGIKLYTDTTLAQTPENPTTTANRTYAIQKNSNDQLVVNVPWVVGSGGGGGSSANPRVRMATVTDSVMYMGFLSIPKIDMQSNTLYVVDEHNPEPLAMLDIRTLVLNPIDYSDTSLVEQEYKLECYFPNKCAVLFSDVENEIIYQDMFNSNQDLSTEPSLMDAVIIPAGSHASISMLEKKVLIYIWS